MIAHYNDWNNLRKKEKLEKWNLKAFIQKTPWERLWEKIQENKRIKLFTPKEGKTKENFLKNSADDMKLCHIFECSWEKWGKITIKAVYQYEITSKI